MRHYLTVTPDDDNRLLRQTGVGSTGLSRRTFLSALGGIGVAGLTSALSLADPLVALPRPRALLIGVGAYPHLAARFQLPGPLNDVWAMHHALQRAGVAGGDITVLAEPAPHGLASAAAPTRKNILQAFEGLAATAQAGQWHLVHVSGHGSQQPQVLVDGRARNGYVEPDGMDEIFLPTDVRRWNGQTGRVEGAIIDDEFGEAFDRIRQRGAHVWAVFDTCHAGDMAKAPRNAGRVRYVPPGELGVETRRLRRFGEAAPALPSGSEGSTKRLLDSVTLNAAGKLGAGKGDLVVFYAAQANEPAAEEQLPDPFAGVASRIAIPKRTLKEADQYYYGVFTHALATQLALAAERHPPYTDHTRQPITLAMLARQLETRFRVRPFPRPLFEGSLDRAAPLFSRQP